VKERKIILSTRSRNGTLAIIITLEIRFEQAILNYSCMLNIILLEGGRLSLNNNGQE